MPVNSSIRSGPICSRHFFLLLETHTTKSSHIIDLIHRIIGHRTFVRLILGRCDARRLDATRLELTPTYQWLKAKVFRKIYVSFSNVAECFDVSRCLGASNACLCVPLCMCECVCVCGECDVRRVLYGSAAFIEIRNQRRHATT